VYATNTQLRPLGHSTAACVSAFDVRR